MGTLKGSPSPPAMGSSRRSRLSPDAIIRTRQGALPHAIVGARASELPIPIRDQVRAGDVVERELIRSAVTSDLHPAVLGRAEGPGKVASPLHPICLLYTSPSPRDRQKSRMPSS